MQDSVFHSPHWGDPHWGGEKMEHCPPTLSAHSRPQPSLGDTVGREGGGGRGHIAHSPALREENPWQVHGRQSRSKHPAPSQLWSGQGSEAACSRPAPPGQRPSHSHTPPPPRLHRSPISNPRSELEAH